MRFRLETESIYESAWSTFLMLIAAMYTKIRIDVRASPAITTTPSISSTSNSNLHHSPHCAVTHLEWTSTVADVYPLPNATHAL